MTNTQEKRTALDAFIEHKARIDEMLERLQAASADHFETKQCTWIGNWLYANRNLQSAGRMVQKRRSGLFADHIRKS